MSDVLNDLLKGRVSSNEVVNWITGSGTLRYTCSKDSFISHFLSWLHRHVTLAVQHDPPRNSGSNGNHGNRSRGTPGRRRADKRRNTANYQSPGNAAQKGSRTPKSVNKTPQTPFKDSLSSLTDYPPLSSSTPVEDTVSRIANEAQVLIVKRKVDFSQSFSSVNRSRTQNSNGLEEAQSDKQNSSSHIVSPKEVQPDKQNSSSPVDSPSSPPAVRRVTLTPAPLKQQMSQLVKQVKENSPFNQDPVPYSESYDSLVSSFNKLSNTDFQNCGQNLDYKINITPTKTSNTELQFGEKIISSPVSVSIEKSRINDFPINGVTNKDKTSESSNESQVKAASVCIPTVNLGNVSSSRKKKIKRVPLMKISNHAKPNWENKSEFSSGKCSPNEELDVKSLDTKFSDRFGGNTSEKSYKSSGFSENTSDISDSLKVLSILRNKSVGNSGGLRQDHYDGSLTDAKRPQQNCSHKNEVECVSIDAFQNVTQPQQYVNNSLVSAKSDKAARRISLQPAKSNSSCLLENGSTQNSTNNKNIPSTDSALPVKRLTLTPATDSALPVKRLTLTPDPSNKNASERRNTQFGEGATTNGHVNEFNEPGQCLDAMSGVEGNSSVDELSDIKRREKVLVHNLAEIYTVFLNEVLISNLATELQLLLSLIKSPATPAVSDISSHRFYFISTVLKGLDVWIRHLAPALILEIEKHVDISITRIDPPPPLFASDISIASVPFQLDEDTRPQFPTDRVFHVFKRIRDSFHSLLRDWEEGHSSSHSWNTEQVLGERMKGLLNQKLQLAIFTHFSKLFISLLLKKYKADLCENKNNPADKFRKLQSRLSESDKVSSKICGPATFPKSQDFFKTFIVVSQNYSLNKHLTDHLIGKISLLDKQTKTWFTDSVDFDQSDLQEDFSWNLLSVQLLGKFLGLVWYMPYYTTQKIPPSVLTTLRESRTEPFPLDLAWYVNQSVADGTLVLTLPWVCEVLVMMDAVCVTLKKSKVFLGFVNRLYNQLSSLPIRQENKVMLLFKLGRVMELLLVPHGLFSLQPSPSIGYEPTLDALPLLNSTLLYACCPWLATLQQVILKQPLSDTSSLLSTPTKISLVSAGNRTLLQLRENFFHHQPHTVRKVCEFVCERVHSNALSELQTGLGPLVLQETGGDIKKWIEDQDPKDLLEQSLSSRLQFFLGALVCKFCDSVKEKCMDQNLEFCQSFCDRFMKDLLPANTEPSVVAVATRLTVDKAREKCAMWWNTMAMNFVEREVQQLADVHIKHVLSEVRNGQENEVDLRCLSESLGDILLWRRNSGSSSLEAPPGGTENVGRLLKMIKCTVVNKENIHIFQKIAENTVNILVEYVTHPSVTSFSHQSQQETGENNTRCLLRSNSEGDKDPTPIKVTDPVGRLDPIFELLLALRDKKCVEIPLIHLPSRLTPAVIFNPFLQQTDSIESPVNRFVEICLKLVYIGVLSPSRLEHWLIWFLEISNADERSRVVDLTSKIIKEYIELKKSVLEGKIKSVPRVAYFVKQYIVSDFEIIRNKINSF